MLQRVLSHRIQLTANQQQNMANHREGYLCRVTRLPSTATAEHVKANFSHFGNILDAFVLKDNFHNVSMGTAFIIFEEESARSALMKRSGTLFCGHIIGVTDDKHGFGRNAYEDHESLFDAFISIGESRNRGPEGRDFLDDRSKYVGGGSRGPWPDRGMIRPREGNMDAGNLEGRLNYCP
ncbi:hypothetical protein POM88_049832 [Heracleum sosnowskyi]|uniref:RRM domain-containing protein n=1 Tax=Heracleum sosnowskyi TaxID=360622 RepID=A0AAD8GZ55_9APIA|nr:hypothetical protein POM88_049832 [Heracleum sosnowskyi]